MHQATKHFLTFLIAPATIIACSSSGGAFFFGDGGPEGGGPVVTGNEKVSARAEQRNAGCPSTATILKGHAKKGEACETYADCEPDCCTCSNNDARDFLGAACIDGVCAATAEACGRSETTTVCPKTATKTDGGKDAGRDSSVGFDSGSGFDAGSTPYCTSGNSTYCYGTGMMWTGSQCCVDYASQCVLGNSSACYGGSMKYTGSYCCIIGDAVCTTGNSTYCYGTGMNWTGNNCCVAGNPVCGSGTSSSCVGTGMHWTGTQCCVD